LKTWRAWHSVDYVRHSVKKPELHNPDPYVKPAGEMDGLTCYRKEYNSKFTVCDFLYSVNEMNCG